ncbi:MAG: NTP transferase domain-containing protein, partial [Anaplasmataceae bacterium]|nr:NTP transferase domain-containing protein [Anaplasmataceae bacterium]
MKKITVIILAAGNGSRMKTLKNKLLLNIGQKPIIDFVSKQAADLHPNKILWIANENTAPHIKDNNKFNQEIIIQSKSLGTGDAIKAVLNKLDHDENIIILYGDVPFISNDTLSQMIENLSHFNASILGFKPVDINNTYGKIQSIDNRIATAIIEHKSITNDNQLSIVNAGIMCIKSEMLLEFIPRIERDYYTNQYHLTDIISMIHDKYHNSVAVKITNHEECIGINTTNDLMKAEQYFQNCQRAKIIESNVILLDSSTNYFSFDTIIGENTTIYPFNVFGKNVKIGAKCKILSYCHMENVTIGNNNEIGPFARIRDNTIINDNIIIGNYTEIKESNIDNDTKIKHFSYIGNTTIGSKTNIGAGTVICNYDGINKHQTTIGDNTFIGANTSLIAPITIGDNVKIE